MTKSRIAYIALTALFVLAALPGTVMNLIQPEMVLEMMAKIGLPPHILTLTGTWKVLGIAALLAPLFSNAGWIARINEWAYAGFFFDLTGAAFLHGAGGDPVGIAPPLVIAGLLVASYALRNRAAQDPHRDPVPQPA